MIIAAALCLERANLYDCKSTPKHFYVNRFLNLAPKPVLTFRKEEARTPLNVKVCSWIQNREWFEKFDSTGNLIKNLPVLVCRGGAGLDKLKMESDEPIMESETSKDGIESSLEIQISSGISFIHYLHK